MPTDPLFVPECYADTALMLKLLRENAFNRQHLRTNLVNHQHGIGNVGNLMERQWQEFGPARRVLGLVDLDKDFAQQPYLAPFLRAAPLSGSIERNQAPHALLRHPDRPTHFLLALNPVFERWLTARAHALGTTLAAYGIPEQPKPFKHYTRTEGLLPDSQLFRLLDTIATARRPAYVALADFVARLMDPEQPLP